MQPRYPVYIPSKGRWQAERRLTSRALEVMGIRYHIVVESQEADDYRAAVDRRFGTVLVLDPAYQRAYNTCDDIGDAKSKGSGSARNFIWDHAAANDHARHWTVDDNINGFVRLADNAKVRVVDGVVFRCMEDFVDRYTNVAMAGPNYRFFAKQRQPIGPFIANTRIYSCNLIQTDLPFRWRGRYNEDTILSLDMLKAGWCTVLFNAFLQNKIVTQAIKGGNTDTVYVDGTLPKSQMLVREHPDVSRLVWKFGRWHHHVDYRPFKANRLKRKPGLEIPEGTNEYGMRLVRLSDRATAHAEAAD